MEQLSCIWIANDFFCRSISWGLTNSLQNTPESSLQFANDNATLLATVRICCSYPTQILNKYCNLFHEKVNHIITLNLFWSCEKGLCNSCVLYYNIPSAIERERDRHHLMCISDCWVRLLICSLWGEHYYSSVLVPLSSQVWLWWGF